jgi:hypothetical protein
MLAAGTAVVAAIAMVAGATSAQASGPKISIKAVLTGLAAPRGITFDGQGNLYVAESGIAGSDPAGLTHTGKVTKYRGTSLKRVLKRVWSTGFDSFYAQLDPTQPPDVLGPEGLSTLAHSCDDHDRGDDRASCPVSMIMSASTSGIAAASGGAIDAPQAGHLYRLNLRTGGARNVANVGDQMIRFTKNHPNAVEPEPDSNPFGVLVVRDHGKVRTFVADAGANTLVEVLPNGKARVVALFPNGALRDAIPTCVAQGPDGALYVGQLLLAENFTFGGGQSNVYRVDPDASFPTPPQVWATGLTTVTGCTFDNRGNFWATEMFGPTGAPPFGDLVKIPFRSANHLQRFGGGGDIPLPGSVAQGPDGALYVTTNSAAPGSAGQVVRVSFRDS